ncbi:hypothetical protein ACOME3_003033 [Neoechinorhynchus agilis]
MRERDPISEEHRLQMDLFLSHFDRYVRKVSVPSHRFDRELKCTMYLIVINVLPVHLSDQPFKVTYQKRFQNVYELFQILIKYHKNLHRPGEPPFFPQKMLVGRYNVEVLEDRRQAIEKFLNFVFNHEHLTKHSKTISFFKKDNESHERIRNV